MDEVPQQTTQPARQLFYNLCVMYDLYEDTLQEIANMAKVHKTIVYAMFVSVGVGRVSPRRGKTING